MFDVLKKAVLPPCLIPPSVPQTHAELAHFVITEKHIHVPDIPGEMEVALDKFLPELIKTFSWIL